MPLNLLFLMGIRIDYESMRIALLRRAKRSTYRILISRILTGGDVNNYGGPMDSFAIAVDVAIIVMEFGLDVLGMTANGDFSTRLVKRLLCTDSGCEVR